MKGLSQSWKIVAAAGACGVLAATVFYQRIPVKTTQAAVQAAPGISDITLTPSYDGSNDDINGMSIGINSSGPFTQDFQVEVCLHPTYGNSDHQIWHPDVCVTTPWASEAGTSGQWTDWVWPGATNYMQGGAASNAYFYVGAVNTRALPSNEQLDNVQMGIDLADDDHATPVGEVNGSGCTPQYSPIGGGNSPMQYTYRFGNCGNRSNEPDWYRVFISSQIKSVSLTSNLPSQMTTGETITTSTITVNNIGTEALTFKGWTNEKDLGQGTGDCTQDTNGDGILDAAPAPSPFSKPGTSSSSPDDVPPVLQCTIPVSISLSDLAVTHTPSSFTTPAVDEYTLSNVTKETDSQDGYIVTVQPTDNCPGGNLDSYLNSAAPSKLLSFLIPEVDAASLCTPGVPRTQKVPASYNTSYNNQSVITLNPGASVTISIPTFTAPNATGTYTEEWKLLETSGNVIPGGVLEKTIVVGRGGGEGTVNISSRNSATNQSVISSWYFFDQTMSCTPSDPMCTGSSQTYHVPFLGGTDVATVSPEAGSAGPQYALQDVEHSSPSAQPSALEMVMAFTKGMVESVADAETTCGYVGASGQQCTSSSTLAVNGPGVLTLTSALDAANFVILWDPIPDIYVHPQNVHLDDGSSPTQSVTVENSGASGSSLNWSADIIYATNTPSGVDWLSLSLASGVITNGTSTNSQNITFAGSNSGLATGTYNATVTFTGTSPQCTQGLCGTAP